MRLDCFNPADRAFTLTEIMVAMAIFMVVVGGVVYSHIVGLRLNAITLSKLGVGQQARIGFNELQDEIRAATTVEIGNGNATTFTSVSNGAAQAGMALRIYPTTNVGTWVRYYFDTNTTELRRVDSTSASPRTIAERLTNMIIFQAEDFTGAVLNGPANSRVLSVNLRFYQMPYLQSVIGTNNAYDFYRIQAKITRRIL